MSSALKLKVAKLPNDDHWRDIARIPWQHRTDISGATVEAGTICRVTIGNKNRLLSVRGWDETDEAIIFLDRTTRRILAVETGNTYEVNLKEVGELGYWLWVWRSSDPAYRIPARISIISFALGVVGVLLGLIAIYK